MKTVELFAGIGGFRLALDSFGIETVWANDMSSKACQVYRANFGHIHEGNIEDFKDQVPDHDILSAGFPCVSFSASGKKQGTRDPRGTLFQHVVDILEVKKPKYFILENVKRLLTMEGGSHFRTIVTAFNNLGYQIEWRLLNAMYLGLPQNRQRVFITGKIEESFPCLTDQLHDVPDSWKDIKDGKEFKSWGLIRNGKFVTSNLPFPSVPPSVLLKDILQEKISESIAFDFTDSTLKWIGNNTPVNRLIQGVEVISNQEGGRRNGYTILGKNGVAPTLTATTSRHYERYKIGDSYRRLTNVEYARIQGFPDNHCSAVSVYDQYGLYGNAVPPPLVKWIIKRLINA